MLGLFVASVGTKWLMSMLLKFSLQYGVATSKQPISKLHCLSEILNHVLKLSVIILVGLAWDKTMQGTLILR